MTSMPHGRRVTVGVDTHGDTHVAVALDQLGARIGELVITNCPKGYEQLRQWAAQLGAVDTFGVEGTGSYGAALTRYLHQHGYAVIEVNRPDRAVRHRRGKSDPVDAEMAARAVQSGTATATAKTGDGHAEMIRVLKIAKDSAVKASTQALLQIKAILLTAPPALQHTMKGLTNLQLVRACAALDTATLNTPADATVHALRLLAQRQQHLRQQINTLRQDLTQLTQQAAPQLMALYGVGPDTAAALLITAGDNPHRLHSEAAFAMLCGAAPLPASSGKTHRHRLSNKQ